MVHKINHSTNTVKSGLTPSNKPAQIAKDALTPTPSNHGHNGANVNLGQAGIAPTLAAQVANLMQIIITLDPAASTKIHSLLGQLLPSSPQQVLILLSHLLSHPKHKFQGMLLLWLNLKKQSALPSNITTELSQLIEKMQLKHLDNANQQIWLLQLPWWLDHQLKPLQLKLVKPKSKQTKRKWQLKLKLPTQKSEMLADCWLDESDIDIKIYCDNQTDLEQVCQHAPLLINQLNQAGLSAHCQHFMGQVPSDLVAEFDDNRSGFDILV
ncbi:hypothetical protein [Motilimonas eburnea]|uniref:hypothetical protein n=1 Tax=Motilimonas eburnea TaxID=1737488 RepID=UPI001E5358C1|nr:hypothetical protein [Motilimonas eburnea]MCE2571487.1 hypothetical protein [Motilimonas eburnea]